MTMLALKEWSIVCRALEEAKQSILLRKGGILEYKKGFEISQKIFLLYPTLEHQSEEYLRPNYLQEFDSFFQENESVVQDKSNIIRSLARIEAMQEFHDQTKLSKLEKYHIWNEKYVNMRMRYNPKKPVSALLLRVYKLPEPISISVNPNWSGCKSWIDIELTKKDGNLYDSIDELLDQCEPVIKDGDFQKIYDKFKEIWN
jgi:hypothetical protein